MIQLAYGVPGAGKSTLLHDLVRIQSTKQRFLVADHDASWGEDALLWRGHKVEGLHVIEDNEFKRWQELPLDEWPDTGVFAFRNTETFSIAQLTVDLGDSTYVDDELDLSARVKGWLQSPLRQIVHQGRHLRNREGEICTAHIMGACRRPQNLCTDVTDLADQIYIFRVQGTRTLKRLLDDSLIEDGHWPIIRTLPNFNFLHWPTMKFLMVREIRAATQTERDSVPTPEDFPSGGGASGASGASIIPGADEDETDEDETGESL